MPLQGTIEEIHENDEDDLSSLTWQELAEHSIVTFKSVIEDFTLVDPKNEEDKLPDQLLEAANTVLNISLNIKSVRSHEEDFERLLSHAASLVVVFWQLYNTSGIPGTMWPPPYLREVTERLVNTVYFIYKLMKRKSQKSINTKRILVGYFGLRDLGKLKKYQRKLGSVASGFESEPNNVNINEVLLDIIKNRAQHSVEDEDCESSEEPAEPVRREGRAAGQEATAGRSRLGRGKAKQNEEAEESSDDERIEENRTANKNTTRGQPGPKGTRGTNFDKSKAKRTRYQESDEDVEGGTSRQGSRTNSAARSKSKPRVSPVRDDEEYDTEISADDPPAPKGQSRKKKSVSTPEQKAKSTPVSSQYSISDFTFNNGVKEGTSKQGSRTKNAAQSKTKARVSPEYDDEEHDSGTEIPIDDPPAPKRQSKKKKSKPISTPRQKVESTQAPPPHYLAISGFTFNNESGHMSNMNVGNIYNSSISDAYNDNSSNWKRKPA